MRKFLKNNLLEIFKTINEAHKIIKGFLDKKEYENVQNLLVDCQNTAIDIGTLIEDSEGEDFITISFLQEYCEALYQVSTNLSQESNGYKVQKFLDKKIIKAENSAKNDIKVRREIVFMPYKASMWDSLESVWKAADEDQDCDAYVVPIPYYDRKEDRSFGQFHYEGNEYPDYVPVVHYESYDLEKRKPDVIYIHNPYDGNNYVTSVDPRFYSSELKKYTECLVYIPYYVVAHENINESMLINSICSRADYIVLQSKDLCKRCINLYSSLFKVSPSSPCHKFIALGSPKFDAIVNAHKNDFELPNEWKNMIANKKIVLYNTSISTALHNTSLYIKKIKKTLEYFKNSTEYILWWRPHPLFESTLASMRPQFFYEYKQLVDDYRKNKRGIYDDTLEMHRAIVFSDMYYGDLKSSLVVIYAATGKPNAAAFIDSNENCSSFEQDIDRYFRDNSSLDILKRNENYDGTAGIHIHNFIKKEIIK